MSLSGAARVCGAEARKRLRAVARAPLDAVRRAIDEDDLLDAPAARRARHEHDGVDRRTDEALGRREARFDAEIFQPQQRVRGGIGVDG